MGCYVVRYCSKECQKSHWETHKADCKQLAVFKSIRGEAQEKTAELLAKKVITEQEKVAMDEIFGKITKNKPFREALKEYYLAVLHHGEGSEQAKRAKEALEEIMQIASVDESVKYKLKLAMQSSEADSPAARGPPRQ